jgi:hypothetical protein
MLKIKIQGAVDKGTFSAQGNNQAQKQAKKYYEHVFVIVYGAQKSIPPTLIAWRTGCRTGPSGWESILGLLERFTNTGAVPLDRAS